MISIASTLERARDLLAPGPAFPVVLQTEATECGLACLAMVLWFHGHHVDLATLRNEHSVSLKGVSLAQLLRLADRLNLSARALRVDMAGLPYLKAPAILHWEFNHFVVLRRVTSSFVEVNDPAIGMRRLSFEEVSRAFTGIALEVMPARGFTASATSKSPSVSSLVGHVDGLKRSLGQILLLGLAIEALVLASPLYLQTVVDDIANTKDLRLLGTLAVAFGLFVLAAQVLTAMRAWLIVYMGTSLSRQLRAGAFDHLLRLPVQFFEKRAQADIVSRFGSIDELQKVITTSFVEALVDGLMGLVTLTVMAHLNTALAIVSLGAVVIYTVVRCLVYPFWRRAAETELVHRSKQAGHFLETIRGISAIKLFERQSIRSATWQSLMSRQINADLRTKRIDIGYRAANGLLFGMEGVLVVYLGAIAVVDGAMTLGLLTAFIAYKAHFSSRTASLVDKLFDVRALRVHIDRFSDIALAVPEPRGTSANRPSEQLADGASLEVVSMRFRYGDQEPFVLDGVNLVVRPGESVAIVGQSGCGKTTLLYNVLGLYRPLSGTILVDGIDVSNMDPDYLRSVVGTVEQDDILFTGDILDNVSLFDPNQDEAWVYECCRLAAIHDEIVAMPMRYETQVGEGGNALSGGQKQRMLLARALYKRPRILILDEATSHLDVGNERKVNEAIRALKITRILVAHRPETIGSADRVLELVDGRMREVTR